MELKVVKTIFAKSFIIDNSQRPKYTSETDVINMFIVHNGDIRMLPWTSISTWLLHFQF